MARSPSTIDFQRCRLATSNTIPREAFLEEDTMSRPVRLYRSLLVLAVCLLTAGRSAPEAAEPPLPPTVTLPAPLARVLTDYEVAWRGKDAAALAALFAEDGFVL